MKKKEYVNTCYGILACNTVPIITMDNALLNRLIAFPFNAWFQNLSKPIPNFTIPPLKRNFLNQFIWMHYLLF